MNGLVLAAGVALVAVIWADALVTALSQRGGGPVTSRVAHGLWRLSLAAMPTGTRSRAVELIGPTVVAAIVLAWLLGLWAGWLLVFSADPAVVVDADSRAPVDLGTRIYFVGFVLWTLGTGTYVPVGDEWEVLTAVASLQGFALITLGVTYLLQVLQAVTAERQLAGVVDDLGGTPDGIVRQNWSGSGFDALSSYVPSLVQMIEHHGRRHQAYPGLRYFRSAERRVALAPSMAALSEALLLLESGVAPDAAPPPPTLRPLRRALDGFVASLGHTAVEPSAADPPLPDLAALAEAGVPTAPPAAFAAGAGWASHRRRALWGLVEASGWRWDDVVGEAAARP
ncbi:hypothetical protein [Rubrivirga litoralis]|uniref:Ion channel n=1 Tax=Rubrivirga litoralis TaxID=3075598 RepID=A0ABU3BNH0_9BACT|nr:hypothetical protein [Rubrivirga sp. F394]MDT0630834.1 hypothetical protein [Rubrivirga sp. F394]